MYAIVSIQTQLPLAVKDIAPPSDMIGTMEFAVNYSPQAAQMFRERALRVDRFKCPDWPETIAEASRLTAVYVHFSLNAGDGSLPSVDLDAVARMLDQTQTPFLNIHLVPRLGRYPGASGDADDPALRAAVEKELIADVQTLVRRFGADRVIAESAWNRPANPLFVRCGLDPALIGRVVSHTGCGFLLDLAHARLAARSIGFDEHAYIEALPLDRLREMHVTGIGQIDGIVLDHMAMQDDDWASLRWALDEIESGRWARPWMIASELGGVGAECARRSSPPEIAAELPRVERMIARLKPA